MVYPSGRMSLVHFGRVLLIAYRESFMGECKKEDAFAIMDAFYDHGGNFIDT